LDCQIQAKTQAELLGTANFDDLIKPKKTENVMMKHPNPESVIY
jgi:hypothetical protein